MPAEIYRKAIWISDLWTKQALTDDYDGSNQPEYWTMPRVISSILAEYFKHLEASDPSLIAYFEKCRERDANAKSISKASQGTAAQAHSI